MADNRTQTAVDYKKKLSKIFTTLSPEKFDEYLNGNMFHVTRKYDGQLAVLFFDGKAMSIFNSNGKEIIASLPCVKEAASCAKKAGLKSGVFGAELYADESNGRTMVSASVSALANEKKHDTLRLAFFDILEIDDKTWDPFLKGGDYGVTHKKLTEIFNGKMIETVKYTICKSREDVKKIFDKWVTGEGSEGLVVYGKTQSAAKLKPLLDIDAAVIGFSESDKPKTIRCLLYALVNKDGSFQVLGRTGNGLTEEQRSDLWKKLMPQVVKSNYVEVDSNHAAFHLIKPGMVVQMNTTEVLSETSSGQIKDPLLVFKDGEWAHSGAVPGYSLSSASIVRIRTDKKADASCAGIDQLKNYAYIQVPEKSSAKNKATPVKIIKREVYKKGGGKLMVQKFMVWKTNKDASQYPSYVFSYTNFSSGRADPLSIDVRISSNEKQILQIFDDFTAKNVTKGWEPV